MADADRPPARPRWPCPPRPADRPPAPLAERRAAARPRRSPPRHHRGRHRRRGGGSSPSPPGPARQQKIGAAVSRFASGMGHPHREGRISLDVDPGTTSDSQRDDEGLAATHRHTRPPGPLESASSTGLPGPDSPVSPVPTRLRARNRRYRHRTTPGGRGAGRSTGRPTACALREPRFPHDEKRLRCSCPTPYAGATVRPGDTPEENPPCPDQHAP
jgi:hypothetical protein